MISVLTWCFSRQKYLDLTLPTWLGQRGVDFEVVVGLGPEMEVVPHPRVKRVYTPNAAISEAYNKLIDAASGDVLLLTQSDIEINDKYQLKKMSELCKKDLAVSDRVIMDGKRDPGTYLYCLMIYKEIMGKVGGWFEEFDKGVSYEDTDLIARILEAGTNIKIIKTPEDDAPRHLHHYRPPYHDPDPPLRAKIERNKALFYSRRKKPLTQLWAEQHARMLTEKTKCQYSQSV
jgi:glycosyltransferase involved in cell wall biosynthesis